MSETSICVWFVCKLCRDFFGQVDAFIEHKKEKHFTEFQNTTNIVFQEIEYDEQCPVITNAENQIADESEERKDKIEVNDDNLINPFHYEIIEDLGLVEVKSELITFKYEINPESENNFCCLKQPEQNPYVLLKRLTSEEIQSSCGTKQHSSLLKCEQKPFANSSDSRNSSDTGTNSYTHNEVKNLIENPPTAPVIHFSRKPDQHFECKLCSKQLESDAQLRIHVGICALYHEDRNRFCVKCNRKYCNAYNLKGHCIRFHGTDEEKLSLYKFKCRVCPKKYQSTTQLKLHLETHKIKKQKVRTSDSKLLKCSQPDCGKEFQFNHGLRRHIAAFHFNLRPFSCSFPNCDRKFAAKATLKSHIRLHTGERPYKCPVDNCNKTFTFPSERSAHRRTAH